MTSDRIIIREYQNGDEAQINLLYNQEYGKNRTLEEWQWEFRDGPYDKSIFVVAEYKGEIIGTRALLPIFLSYGAEEIFSAKGEGALLKREFRGQGIFKKLDDKSSQLAAKRGITLVWAFVNEKKPFIRCGFQIPGRLRYFILILNPTQTYQINRERLPARMKRYLPSRFGQTLLLRAFTLAGFLWFKLKSRRMKSHPDFQVTSITQADERLDVFWQTFRREKKFCSIARTSSYLDWRIFKNPNMIYEFLAAVKDDRIQGYVILGKSKHENVGQITDFCSLDGHFKEVTELLITYALEYFQSQGVAYVDAWQAGKGLETKRFYSLLRRFGFLSFPWGSPVVLKLLTEEQNFPGKPTDIDQWFITSLFSEGGG